MPAEVAKLSEPDNFERGVGVVENTYYIMSTFGTGSFRRGLYCTVFFCFSNESAHLTPNKKAFGTGGLNVRTRADSVRDIWSEFGGGRHGGGFLW